MNQHDPDGWYEEKRLAEHASKCYSWPGVDNADMVKKIALELYGLKEKDVLSPSRVREYSDCRRLMILGYEKLGYKEPEMAKFIGRDRTSAIYGLRQAKVLAECDKDFRIKMEKMYFKLKDLPKNTNA